MTTSLYFPSPELASREGLLAIGGRLDPDWLLDAYRHGIFPWPFNDGTLAWWSPDPRAAFEFEEFIVTRRLARTCRSGKFQVTINRDFAGVIEGCATANGRRYATWLTRPMRAAYQRMHRMQVAHSVEVWLDGDLVGGTYGVSMGAVFSAESMFYRVRDASKVALVHLVLHLQKRGYQMLDIQQLTSHTASLGAVEIPRSLFLSRLAAARDAAVDFGQQLETGPIVARRSSIAPPDDDDE